MDKQVNRALQVPRETLLQYRTKEKSDRVPFVVTYNPALLNLNRILRDLQPLMDNDPRLSTIFPDPPMLAYRQPPNLRKILVRSKITPSLPSGTFPCNKVRCKLCRHMDNSEIHLPNSTERFTPVGNFNCDSPNLVYLIRCRRCPKIYIGETGQSLRKRINGHKHSIRNENHYLPVGEHFSQTTHSLDDLQVTVLKGFLPETGQRRIEEQKLIHQFNSMNNNNRGLNRDLGFLSHYTL